MGHVSGYIIEYNKQRLYIAGDTIWCKDVEEAITEYQPGYIIANGGGAQFIEGGPITMTINDVISMSAFTKANITVVHLDTVNHCIEKRSDFKKAIEERQLADRILIPKDGEWSIINS
jgi:L-ascorbate metabolism protein UlaG (beta-lactamase superfamily)